ncbi:MAG: metallophosphoesterase family protein [Sphingopyxis sp.]
MLSRLFSRKIKASGRWRAAAVPAGSRVYAVGDIHGRLDLFRQLIDMIAADDAAHTSAETQLILLGDYVDRGPDSAALLAFLRDRVAPAGNVTFLLGNHEDYMLAAYDGDTAALTAWVRHGGWETLRSYGLADTLIERRDASVIDSMHAAIAPQDIAFLRDLTLSHRVGDYLFVHAGILPGTPLDAQSEHDILWIRDRFTNDDRDHGAIIVHGHTVTPHPELRRNRIGIDTGAYDSGHLTAVGLEGEAQWFIQTGDAVEPDRSGERVCALMNR